MWNASKNTIPEWQIQAEDIRIIKDAIADAEYFAPTNPEFKNALERLEKTHHGKAIWMIKKGLHDGDQMMWLRGLERLI